MEDIVSNMIGKRIKERRNELHITHKQVYEETGISSGNLSGIETGRSLPSATALIGLSQILQCSTDWILTGSSLISENSSSSNMRDTYIELFNQLTPKEQDEIVELMEFKLSRKTGRDSLNGIAKSATSKTIKSESERKNLA